MGKFLALAEDKSKRSRQVTTSSTDLTTIQTLQTTVEELRAQLCRAQLSADKERRAARKLRRDIVVQSR